MKREASGPADQDGRGDLQRFADAKILVCIWIETAQGSSAGYVTTISRMLLLSADDVHGEKRPRLRCSRYVRGRRRRSAGRSEGRRESWPASATSSLSSLHIPTDVTHAGLEASNWRKEESPRSAGQPPTPSPVTAPPSRSCPISQSHQSSRTEPGNLHTRMSVAVDGVGGVGIGGAGARWDDSILLKCSGADTGRRERLYPPRNARLGSTGPARPPRASHRISRSVDCLQTNMREAPFLHPWLGTSRRHYCPCGRESIPGVRLHVH